MWLHFKVRGECLTSQFDRQLTDKELKKITNKLSVADSRPRRYQNFVENVHISNFQSDFVDSYIL